MNVFDFSTVAVSFILGLAVTYLLESMVGAFRARRTCRLHWLPFVWVGCVLVQQFQFWWALYDLNTMPSISVGIFTMLLLLSGLLFLAGALVLPSGEAEYPSDLQEYFIMDGSWAAATLALYNVSAVAANVIIFDAPVVEFVNLINLAMVAVAAAVALVRSRNWLIVLTLAYVAALALAAVMATSAVYESTAL